MSLQMSSLKQTQMCGIPVKEKKAISIIRIY